MTTNQADIPVIIEETVNPPINQNQQPVVGGQADPKTFPVRALKIFGGMQIGCGILLGILSIIGVVLNVIAMNKNCQQESMRSYYRYTYIKMCLRKQESSPLLFAFDVTCIICSGWSIITGFLPLCMSRKREKSWRGLRVGFMVCSIIGASLFMPTMFSLGVAGAIKGFCPRVDIGRGMITVLIGKRRDIYNHSDVVLSAFIAVLSFVEMVLAIIAVSYCCCCTQWGKETRAVQSTVMFMNASQPGILVNLPQTQIPMNYQPSVLMTTGQPVNPTVLYQGAQQYVVPYQPLNIQQLVPQQQEISNTDNPPECTTEK